MLLFRKIFSLENIRADSIFATVFLRFFYKIVFVISWTLIVTLFVELYGVSSLPVLFLINSLFSILASLVYTNFFNKYSHQKVLLFLIFLTGLSFLVFPFLYSINIKLFLFSLILIESIFLIQIRIFLSAQIEGIFTPLEGQKVFPFTESSETFGGIIAGLLLFLFSNILSVPSYLFIATLFVFSMVPFLIIFDLVFEKINGHNENSKEEKIIFKEFLKNDVLNFKTRSFVKVLIAVVFLQWFLFNLVEFQYISGIYYNLSSVIFDSGSGFEHAFIHDLGALFVLFNISALICQLFLASNLLKHLGIVGSMLIHPILTFFSFLIYEFNNGFFTVLFIKNNFMITTVILNNSYHCSFYAVSEKIREYLRQFLEGIVRPIAALVGTFFIFAIQAFSSENVNLLISVSIILASIYFIRIIYLQDNEYFKNAIYDLKNAKDNKVRFYAIEILAQKGRKKHWVDLIKILLNKNEKISIKIKILKAFGESGNLVHLRFILPFLEDKNIRLRTETILALSNFFKFFRISSKKNLFLKIEIIDLLKKRYKIEKNSFLRIKILNLLTRLSGISSLNFLVDLINGENSVLKREALLNVSNFKKVDLSNLLLPLFKSGSLNDQVFSAIALAKQNRKIKAVYNKINSFINSNDANKICLGIYAIGELKLKKHQKFLVSSLYSTDIRIKVYSAIALSKLGFFDSSHVLIDLMLTNAKYSSFIKWSLLEIDNKFSKFINDKLSEIAFQKLDDEKRSLNFTDYSNLNIFHLKKLKHLYTLANDFDEEYLIKQYINNKKHV